MRNASFCGLGWAFLTEQEYKENKTCAHLQNLTFSDSSVINLLGRSCLSALCVHCSYCISGWWLLPVDHTDCSIYTIVGPQGSWNRGGGKLCNYFNWWCFCRSFLLLTVCPAVWNSCVELSVHLFGFIHKEVLFFNENAYWTRVLLLYSVQLQDTEVSIIHWTLAWITGALAYMYVIFLHAYEHGGPQFMVLSKGLFVVSVQNLTPEK